MSVISSPYIKKNQEERYKERENTHNTQPRPITPALIEWQDFP